MRRTAFLLLVFSCGFWLPAATNPIGMALTNGSFRVDHARVWGTTTLFNGSIIETESTLSELHVTGGGEMRLAAGSKATIYQRKLVLDYGQLESAPNYEVLADSLHVVATGPDGLARTEVRSPRKVMVAAIRGVVRVSNSSGILVANVEAGKTLNLEPQETGSAAPTHVTGCILMKTGKVVVAEQTANVVLELRGAGIEKELGNRVEISGVSETAITASGASQVIRVTALRRMAIGGCSEIAKKIGATLPAGSSGGPAVPAAAAGSTGGGIGAGTIAIIGGVAAAATVGSLGLAGSLPGQSSSPSVSR
jgi:hypothetical protein